LHSRGPWIGTLRSRLPEGAQWRSPDRCTIYQDDNFETRNSIKALNS